MTTLETKTDSAAETGKNLHAWLLKMILVCSKKYTMTYYCRFQCGNCVIMPTGHECSCCCDSMLFKQGVSCLYQENAKGISNQLGLMYSLWAAEVQLTAFCGNSELQLHTHVYVIHVS